MNISSIIDAVSQAAAYADEGAQLPMGLGDLFMAQPPTTPLDLFKEQPPTNPLDLFEEQPPTNPLDLFVEAESQATQPPISLSDIIDAIHEASANANENGGGEASAPRPRESTLTSLAQSRDAHPTASWQGILVVGG
jgi:hypothetical protein